MGAYQVYRFVGKPLSDEGDDGPALAVSSGLVDAVGLLEAAQIFSLQVQQENSDLIYVKQHKCQHLWPLL